LYRRAPLAFAIHFFFTDPSTPQFPTLSLHDALPISSSCSMSAARSRLCSITFMTQRLYAYENATAKTTMPDADSRWVMKVIEQRSEEHTSELQSRSDLVCRLLLEKKK